MRAKEKRIAASFNTLLIADDLCGCWRVCYVVRSCWNIIVGARTLSLSHNSVSLIACLLHNSEILANLTEGRALQCPTDKNCTCLQIPQWLRDLLQFRRLQRTQVQRTTVALNFSCVSIALMRNRGSGASCIMSRL